MVIDNEYYSEDYTLSEPMKAKGWMDLIKSSEKSLSSWNSTCSEIDKIYAKISRLTDNKLHREFQLFWSNIQVIAPSIYSRPPIPVVTPRFKDRAPLNRLTSEILERACSIQLEYQDIDNIMISLRDDMVVTGRGVAWVGLEYNENKQRHNIRIDHIHRKDFACDPARSWREVDWVAKCAYLTKEQFAERFPEAVDPPVFSTSIDDNDGDKKSKAQVWEIWSKSLNKVVWVSDGVDDVLDISEPMLNLHGFFPCPRPVFSTCERGGLIPVPDYLFYKDQAEEINDLTQRIGRLTEAVKMRGFYPAGSGEIADAIESAIKEESSDAILVGVSNWAYMGNNSANDVIVWLPIKDVVFTINALIEMRKNLIDDVYQITGLSDVMRGASNPNETLGAQQLKSQYGSVRIRDKQAELVRVARDIVAITCEILSENFEASELLEMSQLDIPTDQLINSQISQLKAQERQINLQIEMSKMSPQAQAMAQQAPEEANKILHDAMQQLEEISSQIAKIQETITIDKVVSFLRDDRARSFNLDIETDSTIAADENAQKQRATEYLTAISSFLQQAIPVSMQVPQIAPLMSNMMKFVNSQFRVGRGMESAVEEFAETMKQNAAQPKPNPESEGLARQSQIMQQKIEAEMQIMQAKAQQEMGLKEQEFLQNQRLLESKIRSDAQAHEFKMQAMQMQRGEGKEESNQKIYSILKDVVKKIDEIEGVLNDISLEKLDNNNQNIEVDKVGNFNEESGLNG